MEREKNLEKFAKKPKRLDPKPHTPPRDSGIGLDMSHNQQSGSGGPDSGTPTAPTIPNASGSAAGPARPATAVTTAAVTCIGTVPKPVMTTTTSTSQMQWDQQMFLANMQAQFQAAAAAQAQGNNGAAAGGAGAAAVPMVFPNPPMNLTVMDSKIGVKIPTFYGDGTDGGKTTAYKFREMIERAQALNKWSEKDTAEMAITNLAGDAAEWADRMVRSNRPEERTIMMTWTTMRNAFMKRFDIMPTPTQKIAKISNISMFPKETAKRYYVLQKPGLNTKHIETYTVNW